MSEQVSKDETKEFLSRIFKNETLVNIETIHATETSLVQLLRLQNGQYWIWKRASSITWLGERGRDDIEYSQTIASLVAKQLHFTEAAWHFDQGYTLQFQEHYYVLIPYHKGNVLPTWTDLQSQQLGSYLAALHHLKLPEAGGKPFPLIDLSHSALADSLQRRIDFCNKHSTWRKEEWVISHRDLHHYNVVWHDSQSAFLIDWDSTGLIHPFVELIGLAVNCANMNAGEFREDHFAATLRGYRQQLGCLPMEDETLWQLCFHSWLLWLSFCESQGWQSETKITLHSLSILEGQLASMKKIYFRLR
jgi:Ser/Thr protein kinase RdoA (MazF antagonist)